MDFRTLVKKGFWIRAVDFAGHVGIGLALGNVFAQFLPDMFLPFIWIRSYQKNKLLRKGDFVLRLHKFAHTIWPAVILLTAWALWRNPIVLSATAQNFFHIMWDQITHPEPEFQNSLWRFDV